MIAVRQGVGKPKAHARRSLDLNQGRSTRKGVEWLYDGYAIG